MIRTRAHTITQATLGEDDLKVPANMELIILKPAGLESLLGERPYAFLKDLLVQLVDSNTVILNELAFRVRNGGMLGTAGCISRTHTQFTPLCSFIDGSCDASPRIDAHEEQLQGRHGTKCVKLPLYYKSVSKVNCWETQSG